MTTATASDSLAINGGQPTTKAPVPFMSIGLTDKDIAAANEVLKSGMLRAAKKCQELEERFAKASDAKLGYTCANGTCALQLAYGATLKEGDEVIVPAWTYIATASMLVGEGFKPVFCDVLQDSYQIDPADVERRITPNTKAIAATHLYGIPVDIDAIEAIAKKHNLKIIYDAAQAHLATYKGKGLGAFGNAVTYSFYATKNLGTGEGGMVTTNDESTGKKIAALRSHGESDKYLHTSIGFNYRMNDITGAIGCSKLDTLQENTTKRQQNAKRYHAIFDRMDAIDRPNPTQGSDPAWHLYTIRVNTDKLSCTRDEFADALRAEGVPCAVHYPLPLTDQPAFADTVKQLETEFGKDSLALPVSRKLATRVLCIPMHENLTDEHFDIVEKAFAKLLSAFTR